LFFWGDFLYCESWVQEELVLVAILRYLSTPDLLRCGLVCQAWHRASLHPSLWHTVDLTGYFRFSMCSQMELAAF
jgi:hypothetical protein